MDDLDKSCKLLAQLGPSCDWSIVVAEKLRLSDRRYTDQDMLLNAEEAAEFLRSSRVKIYRLVKSGQLIAHKVGGTYVFYLRDLHAYVRGQSAAVSMCKVESGGSKSSER